ncbi:hypothetical protein K4V95_002931 [Listeria monocytogenes]|nr:hypothetical protein [Listeria monocytogenes]EHY7829587.1 hypothetical protein [Listeria monocytogenes]
MRRLKKNEFGYKTVCVGIPITYEPDSPDNELIIWSQIISLYLYKVSSSRVGDTLQGGTQKTNERYWLTATQAEALGIELGTQKLTAHQLSQIKEFAKTRELSDVEFTPEYVADTRDLNLAEKQKIRYSMSPNKPKYHYN